MSTLTGRQDLHRIKSTEELQDYFYLFAKSPEQRRLGLEAEFLGVNRATGKALPYSGEQGIEAVLRCLAERFNYEMIYEGDHVIALKRGETMISLEPGAQVELSAAPVYDVCEVESQVQIFTTELKAITQELPEVRWLSYGIQPYSTVEEVSWVPKKRYAIMADHLGARGKLAHWMMKMTATNQISYDYLDEEDAMSCLRTVLSITPIISALFSNSSFSNGAPNGYVSKRVAIWQDTDPERSGLIVEFTKPGKKFRDFLDYVLGLSILFVVREGKWIRIGDRSFREFVERGYEGISAIRSDFELHLSTVFPEARLKQYLEVRGMDAQSVDLIPAAAAFWKGILYDRKVRDLALKLVSFASESELSQLHQEIPRIGLKAKLAEQPILPLARELVRLAAEGLHAQQSQSGCGESRFIVRIQQRLIELGQSPGEQLLSHPEIFGDKDKLLDYLSI